MEEPIAIERRNIRTSACRNDNGSLSRNCFARGEEEGEFRGNGGHKLDFLNTVCLYLTLLLVKQNQIKTVLFLISKLTKQSEIQGRNPALIFSVPESLADSNC